MIPYMMIFIDAIVRLHIFNIWRKYSFVSYYRQVKWDNEYDHPTSERKIDNYDHTNNSTIVNFI